MNTMANMSVFHLYHIVSRWWHLTSNVSNIRSWYWPVGPPSNLQCFDADHCAAWSASGL